jgi:hypothetical protein
MANLESPCHQIGPDVSFLVEKENDAAPFRVVDHALLGIAALEFHSGFAKAINYQIVACPCALGTAILRFTAKTQIPINYQ